MNFNAKTCLLKGVFLLLVVFMHTTHLQAQQGKNIHLSQENLTVHELFKQIDEQSGLNLIYSSSFSQLKKKIHLQQFDVSLDKLLALISQQTNLSFRKEGAQLVVREIEFGVVRGVVKTNDGLPAAFVSVQIKGGPATKTDEQGSFRLTDVLAGDRLLIASFVGLHTKNAPIHVVAKDTVVLSLTLNEDAQTLEEVTVNGEKINKYLQKNTDQVAKMPLTNLENPQVYAVVPAQLLKDQLIVDYRDAFRNVSGVNSLEQVSNGRTSAFIRGFRTGNFLRNGVVATQLTAVETANLERIEVVKGPSGALFGSSAISYGGLVNRITKMPLDHAQTEVTFTAGSYGLNRLALDMNTPLNDEKTALFRLNAARHATNTFQETGFQRNYFIAPSFMYKPDERLTFSLDAELYSNHGTNTGIGFFANSQAYPNMRSYKELEKIYDRTFSSDDITSTFKGYTLFAKADYKINGKWTAHALFNYGGVDARNQMQFTPGLVAGDSISRTIQRYAHNYYNYNAQLNVNGEFHIGTVRNRVLIGLDHTADITRPTYIKRFLFDVVPMFGEIPYITRDQIDRRLSEAPLVSAFRMKSYYYGAYVSDAVNVTERLLVLLSLRYDQVKAKGTTDLRSNETTGAFDKSTFSPKAGIVYQVVKDKVSLFGNYLNGFNYSTTTDRNGNLFDPERANQWEGGLKATVWDGKLAATASYYHIEVSNRLRTDPADVNFQIQDGTQLNKGFDLELISNPVQGLNLIAGYAYNDGKYTKADASITGNTAAQAPKHIANFWVNYRLMHSHLKGLGLGFGMNYNSDSFYNDANTFTIPEFVVLNSVLSYDLSKWAVALRLDNLTDEKYWGPWGNAQPPRNVTASVTCRF